MTIKSSLVEVSKLLYSKNLATAFEGNISVINEGEITITPSGICKGFITEDMLVVMVMYWKAHISHLPSQRCIWRHIGTDRI